MGARHPNRPLDVLEVIITLEEFKRSSGLTPSLPKSTAYFCNVLNYVKIGILGILPFEEGKLPVKYMGVLLVPSRLLLFRDSVFILPSCLMLDLEQSLRGFLWCQGDMRRGKAKVAWKGVYLPKDKGGLGIRPLFLRIFRVSFL
ncbi:hypothetical protein Tco_1250323 [Tanacetum coccineum]